MWGQPPSAVHRAKLDCFSSQSSNMPVWEPRQTPYQARILIVFHTTIACLPKSTRSISTTEIEETLPLTCHLRDPPHALAPIPFTLLWTPFTRLKIRELKIQTFH